MPDTITQDHLDIPVVVDQLRAYYPRLISLTLKAKESWGEDDGRYLAAISTLVDIAARDNLKVDSDNHVTGKTGIFRVGGMKCCGGRR